MVHTVTNTIRVLYVEDDKNLQLAISRLLEILGYQVTCANNGQLGIEKAGSWQPDIILMDMYMPAMNGPEAIRKLRSNPETSKIPIFVLSVAADAKTREICKEAGADRFLIKAPLDIRQIDTLIKETLNINS